MVRFSLNVVVGLYLMHTDQLPDHLAVKIRNNLQTGGWVGGGWVVGGWWVG